MFYVIISALFLAITLFLPKLSIVTMMLFLIPLHRAENKKIYQQGFMWGLIVFGCYWFWIIALFKNQGLYYTGIILYILITIWCSLFSLVWLYFFKGYPTLSTILFLLIITKIALLPLGNLEGIPFINPLVLLAEYPLMLKPLYYLQDIGMLTIIFSIQNWIARKYNKKIVLLYVAILLIIGTLLSILQETKNKKLDGIGLVTPWWYNQKKGAMHDGYRLAHAISSLDKELIKIIVTPESTFCFDVAEYNNFIPIWCDSSLDIPILLGTHAFLNKFPHNAILLLHNNKIIYSYFKKHRVPFMEKTVWFEHFLKKPILSCDFIPNNKNDYTQNDLICVDGKMYQLFICSELFCEVKKVWSYPILFLWNDIWFSCEYQKKLAINFITYFELKYGVDVYHIATSGKNNINS